MYKPHWSDFFLTNPWEEFTPDPRFNPHPVLSDIGWHSEGPIFEIATIGVDVVIEVGVWKGAGTINLVRKMRGHGTDDPIVICVDTWLGGVEHWDLPNDPEDPNKGCAYHMCNWEHGRPKLYNEFMTNIVNEGIADNVIPISQTSDNAFRILKNAGVRAGAIYVDGSHEYEDVLRDLANYYQLLEPGGVMFGDDYNWGDVKKAVDEFSSWVGATPEIFEDLYFCITKEENV